MSDLVTFVRARLYEREALAKKSADFDGHIWKRYDHHVICEPEPGMTFGVVEQATDDTADHIAANDPAYVLRDIAAKRAIVDELERNPALVGDPKDPLRNMAHAHWVQAVRHLAAIDQDHPDYQQEWKLP